MTKKLKQEDCTEYKPKFPKPGKRRRGNNTSEPKNKVPEEPEEILQGFCEGYLNALNQPFIRIPDILFTWVYGLSFVPKWVKALIGKYLAGLPDIMIPKKTKYGIMLLSIELKKRSGVMSGKQKDWKEILNTVVIYGNFDEFKKIVDEFLKEGE